MFNVSHPAYLHVNFFKNITDHFLTRESFRYHANVDCLVFSRSQPARYGHLLKKELPMSYNI